jgi:hypothetical protein
MHDLSILQLAAAGKQDEVCGRAGQGHKHDKEPDPLDARCAAECGQVLAG